MEQLDIIETPDVKGSTNGLKFSDKSFPDVLDWARNAEALVGSGQTDEPIDSNLATAFSVLNKAIGEYDTSPADERAYLEESIREKAQTAYDAIGKDLSRD